MICRYSERKSNSCLQYHRTRDHELQPRFNVFCNLIISSFLVLWMHIKFNNEVQMNDIQLTDIPEI